MARKPPPPTINWHTALPADGDPLGNDVAGCCVEAAAYQAAAMRMAVSWGSSWRPTRAAVMAYYSRLTGYDPTNPATDLGTETDKQMLDWARNGVMVADQTDDVIHWLSVDHRDADLIRLAIAELGPIQLSFALPLALRDLPASAPWVMPADWAQKPEWNAVWGYHRVISGVYSVPMGDWKVRTWGLDVAMSNAFLARYCVAADATLSRTWFNSTGTSPRGEVWDQVRAEFRSIEVV